MNLTDHEQGPQECVLIALDGQIVKRYRCLRQWGRIQYDGRWFVAKRLHWSGRPENVYVEQAAPLADAVA